MACSYSPIVISHFLDIDTPEHIQGRPLLESLKAYADDPLPEKSKEVHSAEAASGYRSFIELDKVAEYRYLRRAWAERD